MRLPSRRSATTLRPSAERTGGLAVFSSEGLTIRTASSGWPTMRRSSASI